MEGYRKDEPRGREGIVKSEAGQSLVLFVFGLTVMVASIAFVVDLGMAYQNRTSDQASVDAAALAAVRELRDGRGSESAEEVALDSVASKSTE